MALSEVEVGDRVAALRKHKGLTQERLASFGGVSTQLVKAIEAGRRALTLKVAQRLAPILGVQDLSDFYGPAIQLPTGIRPAHEAMPEVRRALTAWHLQPDGEPSSPEYLRGALDMAWATWHGSKSQRSEVAAVLPGLLTQGQKSVRLLDGEQKRQVSALLSHIYHLAQAYMAWHGDRELVWLSVDRGMTTALDSDDPLAIASACWYAAHLLRAVGRSEEAVDVLREARELVERAMPEDAGHDWAATMADLWLCSALTLSRDRNQSAWADWERGDQWARRLPVGYAHPWTRVGHVLSDVYAVMVATELGNSEEARRRAQHIDPAVIPSVDRRARHLIELARGTFQEGSREGTVHLLKQATSVSAETVAFTPPARDMIEQLRKSTGATLRSDVDDLAQAADVDQEG